ncbi:mitogen-activated protein kinase kinase [Candidatus Rickettsiella viridis]|uniref:Mitogen-activated protein kinase kinase n=1 Tax=Candidatus Rickettsiella viridis TaxID=676208 RepID=A0A2Z5V6Y8_9COXI|nr:protein kinase family protein [Candidatus Rickettsiella viridis]BBB14907.1 mitogen-activated protein kinase kinase [Candidatus Rickettsiella viridis]
MSSIYFLNPQVDPKTPGSDLLLIELLKSMKPGDLFKKDTIFSVIFQGKPYQVALTREILCRKRQDKQGLRYEVIDNTPKGRGAFGQVSPTTTLIVHNDHIERKYKRIIKREIMRENKVDTFEQEAVIGQKVPYLHMKPVVNSSQIDKGVVSEQFLIMRHLPGKTLNELLKDKSISRLEQFEKLELSLAILRTFKKELYDKGLIHSDIKPDNIMVHFSSKGFMPDIYLIDFGFSRTEPGKNRGFNRAYGAPESIVRGGYSGKESDTFSIGKIIRKIWEADAQKVDYGVIDEVVKGMLVPNARQRTPLTTALNKMEVIYCLTKANEKQAQLISIVSSNKMFTQVLKSAVESNSVNNTLIAYLESINVGELKEKVPCMEVLIRDLKQSGTEEKTQDAHLINLKHSLREAICFYIQKTYTQSNIKNKDRIASTRRIQDINCLLDCLEGATSSADLSKQILDWEQSLERGLLGRSTLGSLVHQAVIKNIPKAKTAPFSFFRCSNLVQINEPLSHVPARFRP